MSLERFQEALRPLARDLARVDTSKGAAAAEALSSSHPLDGASILPLRDLAEQGMREGWLLPRENGGIRFGRVAKDLEGLGVHAVLMSAPGPLHRHPGGEVDLCFALEGEPRFDGHPEGWVVYPPDSRHVPTVTGGTMLILYFLPGDQIEFL